MRWMTWRAIPARPYVAVAALEALNTTKDPAIAPGISGKWSLLYTGASAETASKRAELEGPAGSALNQVAGNAGYVGPVSGDASGADVAAGTSTGGMVGGKPLGRSITLLSGAVENKVEWCMLTVSKPESKCLFVSALELLIS